MQLMRPQKALSRVLQMNWEASHSIRGERLGLLGVIEEILDLLTPTILHSRKMATAASGPSHAMAAAVEDEYLAREMEELSDFLIEDLREYLDGINTTGRFATMKKLDQVVDPQVRLIGTNDTPEHEIPIPLGSRDALKLIEAAYQAPFGRREETIVDMSVRKYEVRWNCFSYRYSFFSFGEAHSDIVPGSRHKF